MVRIFLSEMIPGESHVPVLNFFLGANYNQNDLYTHSVLKELEDQGPIMDIVSDIQNADYILVPHRFFIVNKKSPGYLKKIEKMCIKFKKKAIIFAESDFLYSIKSPHFIIFRSYQYKSKKQKNEIIVPPIAEDLGRCFSPLRLKMNAPTVAFCGWTHSDSFRVNFVMYLRAAILRLARFFSGDNNYFARNKGLYFRQRIIKILKKDNRINVDFVELSSFGGSKLTADLDKNFARDRYIKNIANSVFSLAVRGDGNFSIRFYEILSMGRIPIFIDTDCVLPLEKKIDYDRLILRVPFSEINQVGDFVVEYFNGISDEYFIKKQEEIRDFFITNLYYPIFFKNLFSDKKNIESLLD